MDFSKRDYEGYDLQALYEEYIDTEDHHLLGVLMEKVREDLLELLTQQDFSVKTDPEDIIQEVSIALMTLMTEAKRKPESIRAFLSKQLKESRVTFKSSMGGYHEVDLIQSVLNRKGSSDELDISDQRKYAEEPDYNLEENQVQDRFADALVYVSRNQPELYRLVQCVLILKKTIRDVSIIMQVSKKEVRHMLYTFEHIVDQITKNELHVERLTSSNTVYEKFYDISDEDIPQKVQMKPLPPRPYQIEGMQKITDHIDQVINGTLPERKIVYPNAQLIKMATGSGKTFTVFTALNQRLEQEVLGEEPIHILVTVDKIDALKQLYEAVMCGDVYAGKMLLFSEKVRNAFQSYLIYSRSEDNVRDITDLHKHTIIFCVGFSLYKLPKLDYSYIVVDEGHHLQANILHMSINKLYHKNKLSITPHLIVMTATPNDRLSIMVGDPVVDYPLEDYLASEYSPNITYNVVRGFYEKYANPEDLLKEMQRIVELPRLQDKRSAIDELASDLLKVRPEFSNPEAIVEHILGNIGTQGIGDTLVYVKSIDEAEMYATLFNTALAGNSYDSAAAYHSRSRIMEDGRTYLDRFNEGEFNILTVIGKLDEAIDMLAVNEIVFLADIKEARGRYLQRLGRGLRGSDPRFRDYACGYQHLLQISRIRREIALRRGIGHEDRSGRSNTDPESNNTFSIEMFGSEGAITTDMSDAFEKVISQLSSVVRGFSAYTLGPEELDSLQKVLTKQIKNSNNFQASKRREYAIWRNRHHSGQYGFELGVDYQYFIKVICQSNDIEMPDGEGRYKGIKQDNAWALLNGFANFDLYQERERSVIRLLYANGDIPEKALTLHTWGPFANHFNTNEQLQETYQNIQLKASLRGVIQQLGGNIERDGATEVHLRHLLQGIPYNREHQEEQKLIQLRKAVIDGTLKLYDIPGRQDRPKAAKAWNMLHAIDYPPLYLKVAYPGFFNQLGFKRKDFPKGVSFRQIAIAGVYGYKYGSEEYVEFTKQQLSRAYDDGTIPMKKLTVVGWPDFAKQRSRTYGHMYGVFLEIDHKKVFTQMGYTITEDHSLPRLEAILQGKLKAYERREQTIRNRIVSAFKNGDLTIADLQSGGRRRSTNARSWNDTFGGKYKVFLSPTRSIFARQLLAKEGHRQPEYILALLCEKECDPDNLREYMRQTTISALRATIKREDMELNISTAWRNRTMRQRNEEHATTYGILMKTILRSAAPVILDRTKEDIKDIDGYVLRDLIIAAIYNSEAPE